MIISISSGIIVGLIVIPVIVNYFRNKSNRDNNRYMNLPLNDIPTNDNNN
jgi:hypothetical protein